MKAPLEFVRRSAALMLWCCCAFAASGAVASNPVVEELGLAPGPEAAEAPATPSADQGPEPSPAAAEMLKSMREKGLLTEDEYEELYRRQSQYEARQAMKEGIPAWLRDWTFGGDVRFRFERRDFGSLGFDQTYELGKQNIDVVSTPNRGLGTENRARLRLRVGAEKKVIEDLTFGFRIATSSEVIYGNNFSTLTGSNYSTPLLSDPRSPNVTLGDFFSYKSIYLDRAYLTYEPGWAAALSVSVGKFGNPFVSKRMATDFMVFDNDISPEGVAADYRFDFSENRLWFEGVAGAFTVQERSSVTLSFNSTERTAVATLPDIDEQNPYLLGFQGGLHGRPEDWVEMGARVSYYDLQNIGTKLAAASQDLGNGGAAIDNNPLFRLLSPNNPYFQDGRSSGRMQELVVDGYINLTPWGERYAIAPYFQYMTLLNADSENTGWMAGVELGSTELVRLTVMYASIGRNATMALFTDSDMFEGFTNAKGWLFAAERELWRGVRVRGAYEISDQREKECALANTSLALCDTASQITNLAPYRMTTLDRQRFQFDLMVDF
jgi:hypothetical protein